jgi:hypothetical protein
MTSIKSLLLATNLVLTGLLMGCSTSPIDGKYLVVIPSDREILYVPAGDVCIRSNTPSWSVPDARMKEILEALSFGASDGRTETH